MQNIIHIRTPENVTLEFELAGVGSRGVAVAIDIMIQNIVMLTIGLIIVFVNGELNADIMFIEENTLYIVIGLLLVFIIQFGYFLIFEYFMKGETPGKKLVGLKVMMANGEPLSFIASLIRNFIRLADMLPGIYGIGIFSAVFSKRYMRVGDLAANTVVVKNKNRSFYKSAVHVQEPLKINISQKEESLLREYRDRCGNPKNPLVPEVLTVQLYHHFYNKIGLVPNLPDYFSPKAYIDKLLEHLKIG